MPSELDRWLKELSKITGTLTLRAVTGKPGTTRGDLKQWASVLRRVAKAMDEKSST